MSSKKFSYFALVDVAAAPGVSRKISNTVKAVRNNQLDASQHVFDTSARGVIRFLVDLGRCRSDIVMIRFSDLVFPIVFFFMIGLRLRGAKIIVDVPTPRSVGIAEIDASESGRIFKLIRKVINIASGSWVLLPAHCIIQYAAESSWFESGVKNKTMKIGNGILIDNSIPCVRRAKLGTGELNLIGVAQLANWHGFDRLIRAMHILKANAPHRKVIFTIVGDGKERKALERITDQLGMRDQVTFTGMLTGAALDGVFEDKDVGVSSLALFRKNLEQASDLKTREYMARGLPVMGVGSDPDFDSSVPYRLVVSNDEKVETVVCGVEAILDGALNFPHEEIIEFAKRNLTLEAKMKKVFATLGVDNG